MNKDVFNRFMGILAAVCASASILSAAPPAGYVKVWEDTFETGSLDTNNWTIGLRDPDTGDLMPGAAGQYFLNSGYAGYITEEDVAVTNGSLYLQNQKRSYSGSDPAGSYSYTSGWIMSMHKVFLNRGYVEFRAKFPAGDKVWPALWLIAEDLIWGPEWDMWEYFGWRSDVGYDQMGMHLAYDEWPNVKWQSGWIGNYDANYTNDTWHTYGFEWTTNKAVWSVDGVVTRTLNKSALGANQALWPDEDMYLVLNNGVKTDSSDTNTVWPNNVIIDYVSLYKLASDPPTVVLSIDTGMIAEDGGIATVTATLSKTNSLPVSVALAFSGDASAADYSASDTNITIAPGSLSNTLFITAIQDSLNELNENVIIDIVSVTNGTEYGQQSRTISIVDDDGPLVLQTWILAGQSNMEGYGITESPVASLAPASTLSSIGRSDLNITHDAVRFYQGANDYNTVSASAGMSMPAKNQWHSMEPYEGLTYDWGSGIGNESGRRFGPELAFGHEVQSYLGRSIALIKYARGSIPLSSLESTQQNGLWKDFDPTDSRANHYDTITNTLQNAIDALSTNTILSIRGLLWMQGEGDATATLAPLYETNLTEFVSVIRADIAAIVAASGGKARLAAASSNEIDIILGTIQVLSTNSQTVIDAQNAVAAADSHVFTVNGTTGLSMMTNDDWWTSGVHYDTAGSVLLGERFAGAAIARLDTDSDGDNIPDSWEIIHLGSEIASDGSPDNDTDRSSDLHEYLAGTDPTNSTSVFMIEDGSIGLASNEFVLTWRAVTNKSYMVLTTPDLNSPWVTNATGIAGASPSCVHTATVSGASAYFKVRVE
jgi:beta-glucanase (GH16 family)